MKICYDQGYDDIGVVIAAKWRHYLFYLEPYFLESVIEIFGMTILWLEIQKKLGSLDVRPLAVEIEALLKCNFTWE